MTKRMIPRLKRKPLPMLDLDPDGLAMALNWDKIADPETKVQDPSFGPSQAEDKMLDEMLAWFKPAAGNVSR